MLNFEATSQFRPATCSGTTCGPWSHVEQQRGSRTLDCGVLDCGGPGRSKGESPCSPEPRPYWAGLVLANWHRSRAHVRDTSGALWWADPWLVCIANRKHTNTAPESQRLLLSLGGGRGLPHLGCIGAVSGSVTGSPCGPSPWCCLRPGR